MLPLLRAENLPISAPNPIPAHQFYEPRVTQARTWLSALALRADSSAQPPSLASDITYNNDRMPAGPWSIHVIRVPRRSSLFEIHAVHAEGRAVGLGRLSEQTKILDSVVGTPVAAINGDFYQRDGPYAGDPRGLQIVEGELISAPAGTTSFWMDAAGEPRVTNTASLLQVTWPDGSNAPIGLNGNRDSHAIELYTSALGPATRTMGGRELILQQKGNGPWLPLRPGRTYQAQVREIRSVGNSAISPETMVLSIGPAVARTTPRLEPGVALTISTETMPNLRGVRTAISGGPVLVRDGKRQRFKTGDSDSYKFSSMTERHPRSAVGWNQDYFFLVEVDGRQNSSVGMTLDELASYLVELGCRDAVNLDGGGSATLWYNGKVRNRPCDGGERSVANSLVVFKKELTTSEKATPQAGTAVQRQGP